MTVSTAERADTELHRDILDELAFEPAIDAGKIGIAAANGVVTLTGTVETFTEKWAAEKAVKRVRGVRALTAF
ncbi:MAG: BON domain-containing protein, partial [Vulcanimicrobiaceae bacterium]